MIYLRIELKVCEGCGALWLRSGERASVYCKGCSARLKHFPVRQKHAGGRPRKSCVGSMRPAALALVGGAR